MSKKFVITPKLLPLIFLSTVSVVCSTVYYFFIFYRMAHLADNIIRILHPVKVNKIIYKQFSSFRENLPVSTMLLFMIFAVQGVTSGIILDHLGWMNWNKTLFFTTSEKISTKETTQTPCENSLYIKSDIEDIVDYIYDELNLKESIKSSIYQYAKEVYENKMTKLAQFENWFDGQPKQLEDVIKDIAENRKNIQPKAKKIGRLLEEREKIEEKLKKQKEQHALQNKKYELYKSICEENCGLTRKISKRSANERQYCGTAEDIKKTTTLEMQKYISHLIPELLQIISGINKKYDKNIENMENKTKEIALKYYGPVMYHTLLLQEEYHTYRKLVSKGSESKMYDVKKTVTMIDADIIQLELAMEQYKKQCLYCTDNSHSKINMMSSILNEDAVINSSKSESLLDIVIMDKIDQIHGQAVNDISSFFQDVNTKIQNIEQRNTVVTNLEPTKSKINNELAKEKQSFEELKDIAPVQDIISFIQLLEPLNSLHLQINELLKSLK